MKLRKGFVQISGHLRMTQKSTFTVSLDCKPDWGMRYVSSNSCTCFCSGTGRHRLGDMAGACLNVVGGWQRLLSLLEKCSCLSRSCQLHGQKTLLHKRNRLVHLIKIANLTEQSEIFCFLSFLKSSGQLLKLWLNGFFSDAISERQQSWLSRFISPHEIYSCAEVAEQKLREMKKYVKEVLKV